MYKLTSHKLDYARITISNGNDPVMFSPTVIVRYTANDSGFDLIKHNNQIIEMIHWLLDQNMVFSWDSPSNNVFNFMFRDDQAAVLFLLSHQ